MSQQQQQQQIQQGENVQSSLEQERQKSILKHDEISLFVYRTQEKRQNYLRVSQIFESDPILRFSPLEYQMSREELYNLHCKKSIRIHELFDFNNHGTIIQSLHQCIEQMPLSLHFIMFIPCIRMMASDEQVARWKRQIETIEWIGCYAQTELAHGSDIQSLETTATFDKSTQEFIIHSPSVSSAKYWPGDLGKHATHAIVVAQLVIDGVKHGVYSFLVQVRDVHTHQTLPGIEVGDIGPKVSWNIKDNGYAMFNQVRIPLNQMLMRYTQVSPDGQITKNKNDKIVYATMMQVRSLISGTISVYLSQALTIAIRYSINRTQFKIDGDNERKLIDYQLQMNKLLPNLANAYATHFGGLKIKYLVDLNMQNIKQRGDFSLLQVVHSILSGTKAFYSWTVHQGVEVARQSCGGQGFSFYSGLPTILLQNYPNITHEGDNTIMALQCARFVMKSLRDVLSGKSVHESLGYLNMVQEIQGGDIPPIKLETVDDFLDIHTCRKLLNLVAAFQVIKGMNKMIEANSNGIDVRDAWDKHAGISMIELAEAHINLFSFECLYEAISTEQNPNLIKVTQYLAVLFTVNTLLQKPQMLFEKGVFVPGTYKLLEDARDQLFEAIRPNALVLVEAFCYSDNSLRSAIGNSNGSYELLYEWSKKYTRFNHVQLEGWNDLQTVRGKPSPTPLIVPKL